MSIKNIELKELLNMKDKEGLVIQGCGGDLRDWQNGINDVLTKAEILLDGTKFNDCISFKNNGVTCMIYPFDENVKLDVGKLAFWRIGSYSVLGGMWLSDYIDNKLSMYQDKMQKPNCNLIGQNGNIFNLMGLAAKALDDNGMHDKAIEMMMRITNESTNYSAALDVITDYVNITNECEDVLRQETDEEMGMKYD